MNARERLRDLAEQMLDATEEEPATFDARLVTCLEVTGIAIRLFDASQQLGVEWAVAFLEDGGEARSPGR